MKRFDREPYFGTVNQSRIGLLNNYQASLDSKISKIHDYEHPLVSGNYTLDFFKELDGRSLNEEPMAPEEVLDYMTYYFGNLPDWSHPGAMINVIPSVNLVSAAVSGIAELFNPNCAQDTYSGNLLLAELEVVKYISELLGWDWRESTGIFTFGGTGTNMYATKLAILNADPESSVKGTERSKYFSITSKNGHPCHYQLCDWLGLGSDSCIEVPCDKDGNIDIGQTAKIVRNEIRSGKKFLGFNLTGGSTNEMLVDSVKEIYDLRESVVAEFGLNYRPMIHVDSVLGWVFLFFKDYDFDSNPNGYSEKTLNILKSLYRKVSQFRYADTLGIDFHKTGFCPYITSLFLIQHKEQYFKLNPAKEYDISTMRYGDYNPFYVSLEYSRAAKGPIAALSCLKSLGKSGFCELVGDLVDATLYFREILSGDPRICVIDPKTEGFATIFSLVPQGINIKSAYELKNFPEEVLDKIRALNTSFGKKVLADCVNQKKHFIFTSSRSYVLPGTDIKVGALKAYPMSVFFDRNAAETIGNEVLDSISELYNEADDNPNYSTSELFQDMSCE